MLSLPLVHGNAWTTTISAPVSPSVCNESVNFEQKKHEVFASVVKCLCLCLSHNLLALVQHLHHSLQITHHLLCLANKQQLLCIGW